MKLLRSSVNTVFAELFLCNKFCKLESIEQMEKHPEKNVVKTLEELEELADG